MERLKAKGIKDRRVLEAVGKVKRHIYVPADYLRLAYEDQPLMVILFILYLFVIASGHWLSSINLSHLKLHGAEVPSGFEGMIDTEILARTTAYTLEQNLVGSKISLPFRCVAV